MRKGCRFLLPSALLVLGMLTSCVHTSPYKDQQFFQAMGSDAEIVLTANVERLKEAHPELLPPSLEVLTGRADRISLSLYKNGYSESDPYPASFSDFEYYGAAEGNFGSFTVNTALSWSKPFSKVKADGVKYYRNADGSLSAAVPRSGLLLFASEDYPAAYEKTVSDRSILITDTDAAMLSNALLGLYVKSPQTMIALGFDIPHSVLLQMERAVLYVVEKDQNYYLNGIIAMKSDILASTMLKLLRNAEVSRLRREGEKIDYALLKNRYVQTQSLVSIADYPMSDDEVKAFADMVGKASGGM